MAMKSKFDLLESRSAEALKGGGAERIEAQHKKGKLTARERIHLLLDEGSFQEIGQLVTHRSVNFGLDKQHFLGDGVITGHGTIDGRYSCSPRTSPCWAARWPRPTPGRSAR